MLEEYSDMMSLDEFCDVMKCGKTKGCRLLKEHANQFGAFKCGKTWLISKPLLIEALMNRSCCGKAKQVEQILDYSDYPSLFSVTVIIPVFPPI